MLRDLKENYLRARAELKGEARSQARMIKNAVDVPQIASDLRPGKPEGIAGAFVRMKDGATMQFHTDGSLRHAFGKALTKAAKKRAKKERRCAGR